MNKQINALQQKDVLKHSTLIQHKNTNYIIYNIFIYIYIDR